MSLNLYGFCVKFVKVCVFFTRAILCLCVVRYSQCSLLLQGGGASIKKA